ncbi:MAG: hypothetical protein K2H87_01705, partial [Duncaniella sp.]|nr:hypothetical protein [Duncaniella sp.]
YKLFRRYRDVIARAAERSARARAAAQRRREARQRAADEAAVSLSTTTDAERVYVSPADNMVSTSVDASLMRGNTETPRGHLGGWGRGV